MNALAQVLEPVSEIAVYTPFRTELAEFKANNAALVFDYEDPKGNKEARSHVYKLRQSRAAVDRARKDEKAASLEYGRKVDAEAKEIMDEIDAMIAVHAAPLEEVEQRERAHVVHIKAQIRHIEDCGNGVIGGEPQPFPILFRELEEKIVVDDSFGEFELEARKSKDMALARLKNAFAQHQEREAERAELERLRAEVAERERAAEKERAERDRMEAQARKAEADALAAKEAEERRAREKEEAHQREIGLERKAAEAAERRVAEAVEQERLRVQREAEAKAADAAKREANMRHVNKVLSDIVKALGEQGLGLPDVMVNAVITAIREGRVPHVTITY